jgi:hypothetical protein
MPVRYNEEKLCFALSIKFNKIIFVSLSFSMLSCQSEFGHHTFLVFSTGFFYRYDISSAILAVVATHLSPTQVSLVALC